MKKIYLLHSGVQHILQPALALQDLELLEQFYTSFFPKKDYKRLIAFLNNKTISKFFSLRSSENLEIDKIVNIPKYELVETALKLIVGKNKFSTSTLPHWRDRKFAQSVAKKIDPDCIGVYGFPNNVLESFRRVSKGLKIIEQPIGYNRAAIGLFKEEKSLFPQFADSITFNDGNVKYLERIDEEIYLADLILVPSQFVKKTFVDYGFDERKFKINQYGAWLAPTEKIKVNEEKKDPLTLLFVGQLSQRKGIKYLLDSVKEMKKNHLDIKMIIVGKVYGRGKWFSEYRDYIDEYFPSVPRSQIHEIYKKADVFVLPSLFEGSALVVYEALAFGLPCIVTENTGSDAIVEKVNGFVIPIRESQIIVEIINYLDKNREVLTQMKQNALNTSYNLSWENYRNRLKAIISDKIS